ncbi:Glycosyltransferase, GT2 family [Belliella buryatensis]|uniref:Glycosyltransferase, GT2 family n=1 Tax=Belliella buryatensis TaxID=1500549 RepID=A0A239G0G0_9BACT|nr:glycosyltransferase [Belliella buryatensis]SNS62188.1 Glycosyltransferase, GT2 family [Belliella buryatensis]
MESLAKVSIICTVYNQADFVEETLDSVLNQSYSDVELIILDNGSQDSSKERIQEWIANHMGFECKFISLQNSINYCKAFNLGLNQISGEYTLDLSGDDQLCADHIERSLQTIIQNPTAVFSFSNAKLMDESGRIRPYYKRAQVQEIEDYLKTGSLYLEVIRGNPISASTMIFDTKTLKDLGGYDESLSYEDFDILIRLTRKYHGVFSDHIGLIKRVHAKSFSASQYLSRNSKMLPSTVKVCQKIKTINQTQEEDQALLSRVLFECKHALWSANFQSAEELLKIASSIRPQAMKVQIYQFFAMLRLDFSWFYPTITSIKSSFLKYF